MRDKKEERQKYRNMRDDIYERPLKVKGHILDEFYWYLSLVESKCFCSLKKPRRSIFTSTWIVRKQYNVWKKIIVGNQALPYNHESRKRVELPNPKNNGIKRTNNWFISFFWRKGRITKNVRTIVFVLSHKLQFRRLLFRCTTDQHNCPNNEQMK